LWTRQNRISRKAGPPAILKKASLDVDQFQDPAQSFMHGMRDGTTNQSPEEAEALGENFINGELSLAV
jgi:hypothetical protein